MSIEVRDSFEIHDQHYFSNAERIVTSHPSGWLDDCSRTDIYYGQNDEVAPRALVYEGISGGVLPFRFFLGPQNKGFRFPVKTLDVGVFDKDSSNRAYSAMVYDHYGPLPLPFFEQRVKRVLKKAEAHAGRLLTAQQAQLA